MGENTPPDGRASCYLFVDCDRFYFAVEAAENPELASDPRPVIIGRDPREFPRGIVTTANDVARALGIRSGMSAAIARQIAPNAVFLRPRHELYEQYSGRVMAVLRAASPLVEQRSIDEAVCAWLPGFAPEPARALRTRLLAETKISVSLGLAGSPLVAKMASEVAKQAPDHLCVVPPGAEPAWLAPMPVRALVGVGPKAEARLASAGLTTIGQIAACPLDRLTELFGKAYGQFLHEASRGIDDSRLEPERASKSISAEHTFPRDTKDRHVLWTQLRAQAAEVAGRLREEGVEAGDVAIKLRYANRETITRQAHLGVPTDDPAVLASVAGRLMKRHWASSRPVRLIGLRAGRLSQHGAVRQLALPYEAEPDEPAAPR